MKTRRKKRSLTLLEIMIVIVLIGLIGSVIGVNMKGSLDEGRAFKSRQAAEQIKDILMLEVARGAPIDKVVRDRQGYLQHSGLVKDAKKFLKDGWSKDFEVTFVDDEIEVRSAALEAYEQKQKSKLKKSSR